MKQTIRKITALLLTASLLCAFTACDEEDEKAQENTTTVSTTTQAVITDPNDDSGNTTNQPDTTDQTNNASPLEILTAAAAKTKNAKSFVIQYGEINESEAMDMYYEDLYTQTVKIDEDGQYTSLLTNEDGEIVYYSGNTGCELYGPDDYILYVSDEPFGADVIFDYFAEVVTNADFVEDFCALNPTLITTNSGAEYKVTGLTVDQLYELMMGNPAEDGGIDMDSATITNTEVVVTVNSSGYFTGVEFSMVMEGEVDGAVLSATTSFCIRLNSINESIDIQQPEWMATFFDDLQSGCKVYYCENGYEAVYSYELYGFGWDVGDEPHFVFEGIEASYDDELVVPVYKVLDSINGIPVTVAADVCENSFAENVYIEKLVLPVGVSFGYYGFSDSRLLSNTELYFEREAGYDENDKFVVIGEDNPFDYIEVKAAYYAGEWEYVDGVPTPKT